MQKNKKSRTQGTSNEENSADDIQPSAKKAPAKKNSTRTGVADQLQGKTLNEGSEVNAASPTTKGGKKSKAGTTKTGSSTKKSGSAIKAAGTSFTQSPEGTSTENNPGSQGITLSDADREAIIASVDADAEKQTGRPTGAIYGSGEDIIAVQNPAASAEAAQETSAYTKLYGFIRSSGNTVYLSQGSTPEGQLQLVGQQGNKGFQGQASGYNEQFVTVLGEYRSQSDGNSSFLVHSIASHNDIARRAYELSESGNNSPEGNWIRAEDEILGQS